VSKKQLWILFTCTLIHLTVGTGLLPLLPVYATQLGADPALTGYYLSFVYAALAAGGVIAGWLSDRFQRRKALYVAAAVAGIPTTWLVGQGTSIWYLTALTAVIWFIGGLELTLLKVLAGLSAEKEERGRVYGVLGLTTGLAMLIGGLAAGPMADRWGYPTMFAIFALISVPCPLLGLSLEEKAPTPGQIGEASTRDRPKLGAAFFPLLVATVLVGIGGFVSSIGRSLAMNGLGFTSTSISSAGAFAGAVTLPLPLAVGWLSDRVGRKRLMALVYLAVGAGLLIMSASTSLWHFWVASSLVAASGASVPIREALATDLVSQASLGRGLSLLSAAAYGAGIFGFAATGQAIDLWGMTATFLAGAALPLVATLLLIPIRQKRGQQAA
jgi:MFS family permease